MARATYLATVLAALALGVWMVRTASRPLDPPPAPPPQQALSHDAALVRLGVWREAENGAILPLARSVWRNGVSPARRVAVLLHGFTNSPHQFQEIVPEVHAAGCAVLAPRLPRHGILGDDGSGLRDLTAGELLEFARELAAVARGLGGSQTVAGFSVGGTLAAWMAQYEPLDHAVVIAPALGVFRLGVRANRWGARIAPALPDWFIRLENPAKAMSPVHHYPGTSLRGFAEVLRIGAALLEDARSQTPRARRITVILNANDAMVDNATARLLVDRWRSSGAVVNTYEFEKQVGLTHDMVDPLQPDHRTDVVNPVLVKAIAAGC